MNDPVGAFIQDCTIIIDSGYTERKDLYIHYLEYCTATKIKIFPRNQVYDSIRSIPSVSERTTDGKDYFYGICLKSPDND